MSFGRVTLPAEVGFEKETAELMVRWGADAVRNSDGTELSKEIRELGATVYSTLCLIRADQDYAYANRQFVHHRVLMSRPQAASGDDLTIHLLDGFFKRQFEVDFSAESTVLWEVMDRTSGETLFSKHWQADEATGTLTVLNPVPGHVYTVNFFVRQVWEPTSMYNHLTNGWTCRPAMGLDPRFPEVKEHIFQWLENWLEENPDTDVVRLTSLFYHFTITGGENGDPCHTDWFGYHDAVSPYALNCFEMEFGYRPKLEDFVDGGSYNGVQRIPSQTVLDWMVFVQHFVRETARQVNERIHAAGKTSMLFFGDHWIGSEPYLPGFGNAGFDAVVGSVTCGEDLRRIADIPADVMKEIRMQPYLFPDLFDGKHDTAAVARKMWAAARRALLRNPCIDRIGYGGYLSLAVKDAAFVDAVADICNEFREIVSSVGGQKPYSVARVGVLNVWGRCRSWMTDPRWYEKTAGRGLGEALSGMPFEVSFIDFDDVRNGMLESLDVLINTGAENSAWSGGEAWADPEVQQIIRDWVQRGGGLLGIDSPSACASGARVFQLSDLFGVDRETGCTLNTAAGNPQMPDDHFLKGLTPEPVESSVFPVTDEVDVLVRFRKQVVLSANKCGEGRAVYLARLGHKPDQARLLHCILLWLVGKEDGLRKGFSENSSVDAVFFPESDAVYVLNSTGYSQETTVYDLNGNAFEMTLEPYEIKTALPNRNQTVKILCEEGR